MSTRFSVIGLLLLSLAACDGHIKWLSIKEQPTKAPSAHKHTLHACGEDVVEAVRAVARSLNLVAADPAPKGTGLPEDRYAWGSSDQRFVMGLEGESPGVWRVALMDWPSSARSALSRQAEREIRNRLKTACSP